MNLRSHGEPDDYVRVIHGIHDGLDEPGGTDEQHQIRQGAPAAHLMSSEGG